MSLLTNFMEDVCLDKQADYLVGLSKVERLEAEYAFNVHYEYECSKDTDVTIAFVTFMEEVHNYTHCDVCGFDYHNEEPCQYH